MASPHGGWHLPYFDDLSRTWLVETLTAAGGFLLGHRGYEGFAAHANLQEHHRSPRTSRANRDRQERPCSLSPNGIGSALLPRDPGASAVTKEYESSWIF